MHLHQLAIVCANLNQYEPVNMKSEDCGRKGVFRSFYAGSRFIKVCHLRSPQSMAMTSEISEPCRRQTASRWPMLAYILLYDRCIMLHHWSRLVGKKLRFDASLCVLFSLWGVNCFFNDKQMRRFVFQGSGWTSKLFNCANLVKSDRFRNIGSSDMCATEISVRCQMKATEFVSLVGSGNNSWDAEGRSSGRTWYLYVLVEHGRTVWIGFRLVRTNRRMNRKSPGDLMNHL